MEQVRTPHYYPEEGWGVFSCQREEHTWEVQKIDDLDILQSDYDAINLARMKGYKVTDDLIVTNMEEMIAMEVATKRKPFVSIRVVNAYDRSDAIGMVCENEFDIIHPLCDAIEELNKDIFILSLPELNDLVEEVIRRKFWSVVEVGTKTTQELIVEHLNK